MLVKSCTDIIKEAAELTKEADSIGCAKLVVFCNAPEDNPFMAGAFHGVGEPDCVINVGVSGPGVVKSALEKSDTYIAKNTMAKNKIITVTASINIILKIAPVSPAITFFTANAEGITEKAESPVTATAPRIKKMKNAVILPKRLFIPSTNIWEVFFPCLMFPCTRSRTVM